MGRSRLLVVAICVLLGTRSVRAADATLVGFRGTVQIDGAPARLATPVRPGQVLATFDGAEATILLPDGSIFTVRERTRMRLSRLLLSGGARNVRVDLDAGGILSEVTPSRLRGNDFEVATPVAVAGVRGTAFFTEMAGNEASVDVYHGSVEVSSPMGNFAPMTLGAGERLLAMRTGEIRHLAARPHFAPPTSRPELRSSGEVQGGAGPQGRGGEGGQRERQGAGGDGPGGMQGGPGGAGGAGMQTGPQGQGMAGMRPAAGPSPGGVHPGGMQPGGMRPGGPLRPGGMKPPMGFRPPMLQPPTLLVPPPIAPPPPPP